MEVSGLPGYVSGSRKSVGEGKGFTFETATQRITLGSGIASEVLSRDLVDFGAAKIMAIVSDSAREPADSLLAGLDIALRWHEVCQHVPIDLVARARKAATAAGIDTVVSVGGGSATGLAKMVALATGALIIALPTTFAGSEATNLWGATEDGVKVTGTDPRVLPAAVIYDADLSRTIPASLLGASAFNALAHCIDSLWAPSRTSISDATALAGVEVIMPALRRLAVDPRDRQAHEACLLGVYLSGVAFAAAGSGMHHKICHVLGGQFDLPHAQTHAVLLPYVLAYNATDYPGIARLARAMGAWDAPNRLGSADEVVDTLRALGDLLSLPSNLAELGLRHEDLDEAALACAAVVPESNPVPVSEREMRRLLQQVWAGEFGSTSRE